MEQQNLSDTTEAHFARHPLKVWREKAGISGAALAAMIGVTPQTLVNWERGGGQRVLEGTPPGEVLVRLSKVLGAEPEKLQRDLAKWREAGMRLQR